MWTTRLVFCFSVSVFLTTVSTTSRPASLPVPGIGRTLGSESRQAIRVATAYHDSDDATCRLPLPAGFAIQSRLVKGGAFYDAAANHIVRLPDQEVEDFCHGTRRIGVVQQLRGAVFPRDPMALESILTRVASDYLAHEVLEDGTYFPAVPEEVSNDNGIARIRTVLRNAHGQEKQLDYSVEYLQQESRAVLVLTVKERRDNALHTYHGLVAKCFADKIIAGCARFQLEDGLSETEGQTALAAIAGIQVKEPAPNPELEKAVIGTWEVSRSLGAGRGTDSRYIFGPNGRFVRMLFIHGDRLSRGPAEPGDYRVYGNLISLRYDKDELVSFPLKLEANVLNLGNQAFVKIR